MDSRRPIRPSRRHRSRTSLWLVLGITLLPAGCHDAVTRRTDDSAYRVIREGQQAALGETSRVHLGDTPEPARPTSDLYDFQPRPLTPEIPEEFRIQADRPAASQSPADHSHANAADTQGDIDAGGPPLPAATAQSQAPDSASGVEIDHRADLHADAAGAARTQDVESPGAGTASDDGPPSDDEPALTPDIYPPEVRDQVTVFALRDAAAAGSEHARALQSAREDLYLAALDLTLERHLWTPQFVATLGADYTNEGQAAAFAQTLNATSDVGFSQRLPYGGTVTARVVSNLVSDLQERITTAENGSVILEAALPLLRGAGRSAYETRYQAERNLIYAVRTYEQFRRSFIVDVATRYFDLQRNKAAINNTYVSYVSRLKDWQRAEFINRLGQSRSVFEAPRAKSILREAESQLVSSKERYESALDQFKIFVGLPVTMLLDVVDQDQDEQSRMLDLLLPDVTLATAVDVALRLRLDLLNEADAVDDARRAVLVARNQILPDLEVTGSMDMGTPPDRYNTVAYNTEQIQWQTGVELRLDDRYAERNAYRASLLALRRAERNFDEAQDRVRADVRSALRQVAQQAEVRDIQALNVDENQFRLEAARAQFELGTTTNQDVVDAENDLLAARNSLADAVAAYRNAILQFRLDTGTLRISDDGTFAPQMFAPLPGP